MSARGADPSAAWADAALVAELIALDPFALGGVVLRGWPGEARALLCQWIRELLPAGAPLLRLPLHITDDRLLGGIALAATLQTGRVVKERGLLLQADGGALIAAMAERLEPKVVSHLCAVLDRGALTLEREGLTGSLACRLGVVALDEGIDGERLAPALRDRLALELDSSRLEPLQREAIAPERARVEAARGLLARLANEGAPQETNRAAPAEDLEDGLIDALCKASAALGIDSLRAPLLALAVARAHAALCGRAHLVEEDAAVAARLVLGPRATRMPAAAPEETSDEDDEDQDDEDDEDADAEDRAERAREQEPRPPEASEPSRQHDRDPAEPERALDDARLEEIVLAGAKSAIPQGLLDALATGRERRAGSKRAGQSGALRASNLGGRPAGTLARQPQPGDRLNIVETLRAAAPWQPLRRRERTLARGGRSTLGEQRDAQEEQIDAQGAGGRRIEIRREDFRVTRFQQRSETSVIFAVDASGSAALQRLAEAKGAVEQVLADCYVRRDHVALIAFRGTQAALLLPPTRSLVSVRRSLARLAGGGTTPLAAGIDGALALALEAKKRGQTPLLVFMTDGKANIARDGRGDRRAAETDALAGARRIRAAEVRALFLDTSPRPRQAAQLIASAMGARYLPLPYFDAAGISRQVQSLAEGARR